MPKRYKKSKWLPETYITGFFMVASPPALKRGYWHFRAADSRGSVRVCIHASFGAVNQGDYLILAGRRTEDNGGGLLQVQETDFCQRYENRRQFYQLYDHVAVAMDQLRNRLQTQEQIDLVQKSGQGLS